MAKISDELKRGISQMPDKEKDKLLFRLVAKDIPLVERLTFELLEDRSTLEGRVRKLEVFIATHIPFAETRYLTPGYLLMDLRSINAEITRHVKTTKDKLSEVLLPIIMLNTAFERHMPMLKRFTRNRSTTFTKYVIQRLTTVLKKLDKLDPDYYLEIEADLNKLLAYVYNFDWTAQLAGANQIPKKWTY